MTAVIKAVETVEATPKRDIGFLHAGLIQCGLPRNAVEGLKFERENGDRKLIIRAGVLGAAQIQQPVPYGALPRLIMVYICTKAVEGKFQQNVIELESSVNAFMTRLGVATSGQSYKNLRTQMNAVAACEMSFIKKDGDETTESYLRPVRDFTSIAATEDGKPVIWPRELVLSLDFLKALEGKAVPLNYEALAKLKGSSLALDAYAWLAHKLPNMNRAEEYLSWEVLKGQFGHEHGDVKHFSRDMKAAIIKALATYPAAKVEFPHGRLRLFKSDPPIARKGVALKALPGLVPAAVVADPAPIPEPAVPVDAALGCDALEMDDAMIAAFNKAAKGLPRGFDRYAILADYKRHMIGKPRPKHMRQACIYWALGEHRAGRL